MSQNQKRIAFALIVAAVSIGWFFRYDLQVVIPGGQGAVGAAYMLNRWTGTVYFIAPTFVRELGEAPKQ